MRRDFIAGLGSAAAWPLAGGAQQPAIPVIGFLSGLSPEFSKTRIAASRSGLTENGFVEGRNVALEYRFASGTPSHHPWDAPRRGRGRDVSLGATGVRPWRLPVGCCGRTAAGDRASRPSRPQYPKNRTPGPATGISAVGHSTKSLCDSPLTRGLTRGLGNQIRDHRSPA
jgi:hypothetical protein